MHLLLRCMLCVLLTSLGSLHKADAQDALTIPENTKYIKKYNAGTPVLMIDGNAISLGDLIISRQEVPPQIQKVDDKILYEWLIGQTTDEHILADMAKKQGLNDNSIFKKKIAAQKRTMLAKFYLASVITPRITEDIMKQKYEDMKGQAEDKHEVRARHILVKTQKLAKNLAAQLKKNADFESLAKKHSLDPGSASQGGDLGWFTFKQMTPAFAEVAFSLKKGEVSSPVKTAYGWHIIKMITRRPQVIPKFEEIQEHIFKQIADEMTNDILFELRKEYAIKFPNKGIPEPSAIRDDSLVLN